MLKTFVGFKGVCAFAQIDKVQFILVAKNEREMAALWLHIMKIPLDPNGLKKAILIESKLLPDKKTKPNHEQTDKSSND